MFKTTNALWVIFNMHLLQYFGNLYEHSICTCHVCRLRIFMGFIIIHCLSNVCRVGVTVVHVYLIESLPFSDSSATALLTRLRSPIQSNPMQLHFDISQSFLFSAASTPTCLETTRPNEEERQQQQKHHKRAKLHNFELSLRLWVQECNYSGFDKASKRCQSANTGLDWGTE